MPKKEQRKFVLIHSNMGDEIQALVIDGQVQSDNSIYKRVMDINGIWRITKHSEEFIKQSKKTNYDTNINMSVNAPAISDLAVAE